MRGVPVLNMAIHQSGPYLHQPGPYLDQPGPYLDLPPST